MISMDTLIQTFGEYLRDNLGISILPKKWEGCRSLPVFMQGVYDCYTVGILNEQCLLLVCFAENETTPSALRKHFDIVRKKWHGAIIVVKRAIRSNDRQRLIKYKIPFAIPGNQLYLPDIGLDLREHFREIRNETKSFSPSTQVLVLYVILTRHYNPLTSTQLVRMLPYTSMTVKRAFDEIEQTQIGSTRMRGRERELVFATTGRELWDAALPFLRSPVQRQVYAMFHSDPAIGLMAGLTALSHYSMISEPETSVFAISPEVWKTAKLDKGVLELDYEDEDAYKVEIWRYDPTLLSKENTVDRLSLFLSLRDSNDERIEAALDEMMEGMQW